MEEMKFYSWGRAWVGSEKIESCDVIPIEE